MARRISISVSGGQRHKCGPRILLGDTFPARKSRTKPHVSNSEGNFALDILRSRFQAGVYPEPAAQFRKRLRRQVIERYGEGCSHVSIDLKDFDATRERSMRDGIRVVDESETARRAQYLSRRLGLRRLDPGRDGLQ